MAHLGSTVADWAPESYHGLAVVLTGLLLGGCVAWGVAVWGATEEGVALLLSVGVEASRSAGPGSGTSAL